MKARSVNDDLRRKFGVRVVELIQCSPRLERDIKKLYSRGVHIRRINGRLLAYSRAATSEHPGGLLCIGAQAGPVDTVLFLAHEAYHILYGKTVTPDRRRISREQYVRQAVREEISAVIYETRVAEELWEAGHKLAFRHMSYLASYLRGGYREVRARFKQEKDSISGNSYQLYYQKIYDRAA